MRLAGRGFASTMPTSGLLGTGSSCAAACGTGTVAACAGKGLASTAPTLCLLPSSDSAVYACKGSQERSALVSMPYMASYDTQRDVHHPGQSPSARLDTLDEDGCEGRTHQGDQVMRGTLLALLADCLGGVWGSAAASALSSAVPSWASSNSWASSGVSSAVPSWASSNSWASSGMSGRLGRGFGVSLRLSLHQRERYQAPTSSVLTV